MGKKQLNILYFKPGVAIAVIEPWRAAGCG
jgi:hypothetical protein